MSIQSKSPAAAELEAYFDSPANYSHANNVAALVLEHLPNGEHAWLRPEPDQVEDDEARWWPTAEGRDLCARWRARDALFSRDWPTVAEAGR